MVYGGSGFFGRLVVEELLRNTSADILVASRNPKYINFGGQQVRAKFAESDLNDYGSFLRTIDGARVSPCFAVEHSSGLLQACIEKKISRVDNADDRSFVDCAHKLAAECEKAGIAALIGCSVVSGLTSLLTQCSRTEVGDIESVDIAIPPVPNIRADRLRSSVC